MAIGRPLRDQQQRQRAEVSTEGKEAAKRVLPDSSLPIGSLYGSLYRFMIRRLGSVYPKRLLVCALMEAEWICRQRTDSD